MKNGKSQDEQLLSAEHFKFGGPSLVYLLKSIFEKILLCHLIFVAFHHRLEVELVFALYNLSAN
jgi:hypothetical protein